MNSLKCKRCGQFANNQHMCSTESPSSISLPRQASRTRAQSQKLAATPKTIMTKGLMKPHEAVACIRLMSTALGNPVENGRGNYAQKQARIVLEQRFGKIDWSK